MVLSQAPVSFRETLEQHSQSSRSIMETLPSRAWSCETLARGADLLADNKQPESATDDKSIAAIMAQIESLKVFGFASQTCDLDHRSYIYMQSHLNFTGPADNC